MSRNRRRLSGSLLIAVLGALGAGDAAAYSNPRVREEVNRAKREARGGSLEQATALTHLAWPEAGPADRELRAAARYELVEFGHDALRALVGALERVDPLYTADVTATLIEARYTAPAGSPPDYLPGLESAIWSGSAEAKRLAILEVSRYRFPQAVLSTVDAARSHPELVPVAIDALGRMRDGRARFFLGELLYDGPERHRPAAAASLGRVGKFGMDMLREAARAERPEVRRAALQALIPIAEVGDLTLLHAFAREPSEGDAQLAESALRKAIELERELEARQLAGEDEP